MNYLIRISLLLIILTFISGCNKKNDFLEPENKNYYVRYELKTSSIYIIKNVKITILTENGEKEMMVPIKWEGTFGPFNDSELLYLNAELTGDVEADSGEIFAYNNTTFTGRISISVNNSPFVLKSEESAIKGPLYMWYKVNIEDLK